MSAWDTWRNATASSKVLSEADAVSGDDLAKAIAAAECDADGFSRLRELAVERQLPPW